MKKELFYEQASGRLLVADGENLSRLGTGYAGQPPYVNSPEAQGLKARGPIPRGRYRVERPFDHVRLGPVAMFLAPERGNDMQGRSGFFIHGDNSLANQTASHGCIILPRKVREKIAELTPIALTVR